MDRTASREADLVIRDMRPEDARAFLEIHHRAVRGVAANDYPPEVIDAWAPAKVTDEAVAFVRANPEGELRLIAEIGGRIVGVAALVAKNAELRACYVAPEANRRGVGSALVRRLEQIASAQGLAFLELDASVTATPFYEALKYEALERGEHVLADGQRMACVKMRKAFRPVMPPDPRVI
jgi:putative acetyltransferase